MATHLLRSGLVLLTAALGLAAEYPKAYLSNGQVWIQTSASKAPFQATHDGTTHKSEPLVSPSGENIVYGVLERDQQNIFSLNIVFLDWSGTEIRRFSKLPTKKLADDICGDGDVEWIDDEHVGVECEFNPSVEDYLVLNALSGKVEREFPGLYFSWSPNHQILAHIGTIIHFATPADQNYCLFFNDMAVYTPGCSNEVHPTKAGAAPGRGTKGNAIRSHQRTPARVESEHYQNIHTIDHPLVWSPNGRNLAFIVTIYDFDWGMNESGEETRETGNFRKFVAIVSIEHRAVGYRLTEQIGEAQLEWLDDSHVKVEEKPIGNTRAKRFERTFDLAPDPPKPIP